MDKVEEKVIGYLDSKEFKPMVVNELARKLDVPAGRSAEFFSILKKLDREGRLSVSKSKMVFRPKVSDFKTANMHSLTKTGGFACLADKTGDVFIQKRQLNGAMPTDVVLVKIVRSTGRLPEAEVVKILERNFSEFTGIFCKHGTHAFIMPDNGIKESIEVVRRDVSLAHDRDKVFARIKKYPDNNGDALASVIASYGPAVSAVACCQAVLDRKHVRREFPPEVLAEAKKVSQEPLDYTDRLDLRDKAIFTIDSAKSKDLDDAVSVDKVPGGYRLGVHIADVSHYVRPGSELDNEAFTRGTSIYYANSVIPMLPEELSNGICSLNPNEDRLAFSALMDINENGEIIDYKIRKSVIRSRVKGVYDEINQIFADNAPADIMEKYREVIPTFPAMRELANILEAARKKRGALDFDTNDCEIIIGDDGVIVDIRPRVRGESERMIEDFMLCANEAVATFAKKLKMPFVYRVHEQPEAERLENLATSLKAAGIDARKIKPGLSPLDMADVLHKIEGSPKSAALNDMVLRSLAKARYSQECLGHFGLALKYYSHFTSPIRRYPDLTIHRILGDILAQGAGDAIVARYGDFVIRSAEQSSEREVNAMQVEWDCEDIYKAEYMAMHIGEQYEGIISSVKAFGIYVELENSVEGMVRVEKLPGWFEYDEKTMTLFCQQSGFRYSIGDKVKVIVAASEVATGRIDFELI